ncbi:hypothetical protein ACP70R_050103 [Stipagrostis hirtigluma subsp. patula]
MESKSEAVVVAPEINRVAAPAPVDGSVASAPKPANGVKATVAGGVAKGTSRSFVEWILEPLTSCYHSCCDVEQDDD